MDLACGGLWPNGSYQRQAIDDHHRWENHSFDVPLGSLAAWAQRQFWGAAVRKGSWFAILQRLGMKGASGIRPIISAVGGGLGSLFGKIFN